MPKGKLIRARRAAIFGALAALATLLALSVAPSSGAAPTSVLVGAVPAIGAGTHDTGALAPGRRLALTMVLRPRDAAALQSFATAVSTPGSPLYHHYLGVRAFAARFGAGSQSLGLLRSTLRRDGLHVGTVAHDGLSLAVSGTVERISHTFGVRLHGYREASGREIYANVTAPRMPEALGGAVEGVLGLDDLTAVAPAGLTATARQTAAGAPRAHAAAAGGAPTACPDAASSASDHNAYTIDEIDHAYGIDGLYAQGDTGAGVTVALLEAETYPKLATDIGTFEQCYFGAVSQNVSTVTVDGGPAGGDGEETSVDIQNTLGVAPAASIVVYQGPHTEQGTYLTMQKIITDNTAKVIQDAWAECESVRSAANMANAENSLLQEAAAQGQSFLTSSGDRGSEACQNIGDPNEIWGASTIATQLAVEDPAGQPYATAVGGTELTATGPAPTEAVWNQFGWGAGGGGISNLWPMPAYQASYGAPGVVNAASSGSPCGLQAAQYCREVPDVSASASTRDGYMIFYNDAWTDVGGTSTSTPVWAGLIALADASNANGCSTSKPLGFLNPSLYEVAAGPGAASAFNDITSGDNNPSNTGAYAAGSGYDMATGLGSPIATDGASPGLVAQLCEAKSFPVQAAPAITQISTKEAPVGTMLTISGSGFTPFARVFFGTTAATGVTFVSTGTLQVTIPPGNGVVNVSVTTAAGTTANSVATSFSYAPSAAIVSPAAGGGYTQGQKLSASYSCASSTPTPPSCTGTAPNGAAIDTSTLGQHQFSVTAIDSNQISTTTTATYTIVAAPAIAISGPASGATYVQGQVLPASFHCSTSAPVTIASCAAPVANGAAIDTHTLGAHTFTVSATDSNGVSTTQSVSYEVVIGPHVTISKPANGANFVRGASPKAVFSCSAAAPAKIVSCSASGGTKLNTATVGTHHFSVTAKDNTGTASTTTVTYYVVAAQPQISAVRQAFARWLASGGKKHAHGHVGTTFSFALDQPAKVTLRFAHVSNGRLAGGRCVAASAAATSAHGCTRSLPAGAFSIASTKGSNALSFDGRTSTGTLGPGSYSVTLTAVGLSGKPSKAATLHFTIASS